jgi:hypothetical protein
MKDLQPIISYSMDDTEAKAFKLALIWEEECSRELPGEKFDRLKRGKDPRKTNLFKYCYKAVRELKGIVPDKELQLFVRSQIQILKSIGDGKSHALINPQCLVGDKAWKRWKLWKFKHDRNLSSIPSYEDLGIGFRESSILAELSASMDFIRNKGLDSERDYSARRTDWERWISTGEISPFYCILSPRVRNIFEKMPFDESLYRPAITPKIEKFFREMFENEFAG